MGKLVETYHFLLTLDHSDLNYIVGGIQTDENQRGSEDIASNISIILHNTTLVSLQLLYRTLLYIYLIRVSVWEKMTVE